MPTNLLQESFGIPRSLLDQVTVEYNDVKMGKKYIDSDGNLRAGTLLLSGTAYPTQVLSDRTFYSNSWTKQTGTMTNHGAWNCTLYGNSQIIIPAGYHNGGGVVKSQVWDYDRFLYMNIFFQPGYGSHPILEGAATVVSVGNGHYPGFDAHQQNLNSNQGDLCGAGMINLYEDNGNVTLTAMTRIRNIFGPNGTTVDYDAGYQWHLSNSGSPHIMCFCKIWDIKW